VLLCLASLATLASSPLAHELRPAYLQLTQTDADNYDVLWKVPAAGDQLRLKLYVRFPEDTEETSEHRAFFADGAYLDRWSVRREGGLDGQTIIVDGLASTKTDVLVRAERIHATTYVTRVEPADPSFVLDSAPSVMDVAGTYFMLGVEHILLGIDHLLFVAVLMLLVRGTRLLIKTITAFTVAHSITLAAATLGWVSVPGKPVEAIIALSIVFVAAEALRLERGTAGLSSRAPWIVAFGFGLLHGFGFAGALHEVGLPTNAIPIALLLFNVGVEVGQLLFVAALFVVVGFVLRRLPMPPSWARAIPAYAIGIVATYWTIERLLQLGAS
jgi:hypothetical protein